MNNNVNQTLRTMIGDLNLVKAIRLGAYPKKQRRAFQAALAGAYTTCARHYYPKWASYFMDEEFQARAVSRLRACYLQGITCFKPIELAAFWADQMGWLSEEAKQRHVVELVPVASRFLRCLEAELCLRPELQPAFDCAAR